MRALLILALGLAVATVGTTGRRIVGGSLTTISQYPMSAALLRSFSSGLTYSQACGGSILNNRAILTAAHCFDQLFSAIRWRIRVGSSYSNSGGVVADVNTIIRHPSYNSLNLDNDIAIIRISGQLSLNNNVLPGSIAGANYTIADDSVVWVIGWGATSWQGPGSAQLRHVQVWTVNQATCRNRYAELGYSVTDNMMCSGWLDVGGRDGCQGDSGGPVFHNNVIVAITSWGEKCAMARYPGVNVRVSRFTTWILNNR